MFKVGDKVVGNSRGYSHREGSVGVITEVYNNEALVLWSGEDTPLGVGISWLDPYVDDEPTTTTIFKPGDKINWKWKKDKWGDNPEWQERAYTINEHMTRAYHDDGGFISLLGDDKDYRLVKPTKEEPKMTYKTWGEMSPEEKGLLLLAQHEGKTIETKYPEDAYWESYGKYSFDCDGLCYRVKPEETQKEPEREVVAFKIDGNVYIKVNNYVFVNYSLGIATTFDTLAVFNEILPEADEVFYKGDTISFVL